MVCGPDDRARRYYYHFWRPVTAVALAGTDNNAATAAATGWEVLAPPTPPVPDYPSAHSTAGAAGAAVIEALIPGRGRPITTTSGSLPGVSRTFATVADAAKENADSRVFIGYHFRHATIRGYARAEPWARTSHRACLFRSRKRRNEVSQFVDGECDGATYRKRSSPRIAR